MLVILKIGYQRYVLPDDKGLQTVMRVLSKAQVVEDDQRYLGGGVSTKGLCQIEAEILPPTWRMTNRKPSPSRDEVLDAEIILPNRRRLPGRRALPPGATGLPPARELLLGP